MGVSVYLLSLPWERDRTDTDMWMLNGYAEYPTLISDHALHLTPFEVKARFYTDRTEFTIPDMSDDTIRKATHVLVSYDRYTPTTALYRIESIEASTLALRSHLVSCTLDVMGTFTLNEELPGTAVSASWDLFPVSLGERCVPYESPMVVSPAHSVKLPRMIYVNNAYVRNYSFFCVTVAGINAEGGYALYGAVCRYDYGRRVDMGGYPDSGEEYGYVQMPTVTEIVDDPESFTPFASASQITGMYISRRWAFPGNLSESSGEGYHYDPLYTPGLLYTVTPSGTAMVKLDPFGRDVMTRTEIVTGTLPMDRKYWSLATAEIRDTLGRVVGTIDTRLAQGSDDQATLSGFKLETVASITGIQSRLVFPDGSRVCWSEGTLPYNSSAYKEYLAYTAEYDRQMLSIANQRALTDLTVGSMESAVNGILAGGLTGGSVGKGKGATGAVVGGVTTLVGIAGNVIRYQSETELRQQELDAKVNMIKATPDTAYLVSADSMLAWIRTSDTGTLPDFGVDSIAVRLPKDSFATTWNEANEPVHSWLWAYFKLMAYRGVYAGGRMGALTDTILSDYILGTVGADLTTVKARDVFLVQGSYDIEPWLHDLIVKRLKGGVRLRIYGR